MSLVDPEKLKAYHRAYYRANKARIQKKNSEWYEKNREYAIACGRERRRVTSPTRPDPGFCEICGDGPENGGWKVLALDHDHATGKFRGWLCNYCNRALGMFRDNVSFMRKAISYLEAVV
jgi:hypothetical protein